ncbi:metal-dependent hydrolase [Halalkalibacterium ligniniphilum]|uniref:metal-dependent hydrolase n=1 Tax=Halalkalibacterium ligniniphilum TaxID=1134413 RepID=UPI000349C011|nr:metal-dependent hydrolase [Halalkalibacterium ligniniphilum]
MKGPTHILGGLAAATISTQLFDVHVQETLYFYSAALFGSVIPDICHPKSMVGRMVPFISHFLLRIFGHRSVTHSLLFLFLITWLTNLLMINGAADIQAGLLIGIVSHLILDAMTPRGIRLLYPIKMSVRFPFTTKTGSVIGETFVCVVLLTFTILSIL